MTPPVALITGASSGIGQATAVLLAHSGFRVFGTSRTPDNIAQAAFTLLALDVRVESSVHAAVAAVLDRSGRIDVLVNNAGYVQSGAIEEVQPEEAHSEFETNVYGVMRVTQAVLPVMRRQRSGHIINVSSVLGQVAPPFAGVYAASKFALEGMTEALRSEVRPFGVHVSLVEPEFVKSKIVSTAPGRRIAEYDTQRRAAAEFARQGFINGLDPSAVAEVILRISQTASPGLRYRIGRNTHLLIGLKRVLPEPLFERFSRRAFGTV
jgi:NAD(P)-dependent dehydrogenase (short-subunit alcohol dehydrogenase family)